MAGPAKKRAAREKTHGSSEERSSGDSGQHESTQRSSPQSLLRFDGNRDPEEETISYSNRAPMTRDPNASEVIADPRRLDLGMLGWATARGVSACFCIRTTQHDCFAIRLFVHLCSVLFSLKPHMIAFPTIHHAFD